MKTCPNCGESVQDTAKFCGNCAAPMATEQSAAETPAALVEETVAPTAVPAEEPVAPAATQAPVMGFDANENVVSPAPAVPVAENAVPKKNGVGKGLLIGGIGVLGVGVVAAAIGLAVTLFGGGNNDNVYYYKDGEIVASTLGKEPKHWELTDRLSQEDLESYEISMLSYKMLLSDDGKTLFYPERLDTESGLYTLFYKDANDSEAEPVKVDSEVSFYAIDEKATKVYYVKGDEDDATLYCKSLKDDAKTKIADGVESYFCATADLSRILYAVREEVERTEGDYTYTDTTNDLYLVVDGGEPERIDRDVDSIEYLNKDLTELYYVREDSLYYKKGNEEKVKIASDVYGVIKIYDSGEMYFVRENEGEVTLSTYVEDDLRESDAAMEEPVRPTRSDYPDSPDYPSWFDYDTDEEYDAAYEQYLQDYAAYEEECDRIDDAYDKAYDQYWIDYDLYEEKLDRDSTRESLEEYSIDIAGYTLCYYNGSEIATVNESVCYSYASGDSIVDDAAKILFESYASDEIKKVKISEMGNDFGIYDLENQVREALYGTTIQYMAVGAAAFELSIDFDENGPDTVILDEKGDFVYYYLDAKEDGSEGDLYRAPVTENGLGTEELYDTEVYTGQLDFDNGHLVYFKDVPQDKDEYWTSGYGDLYIDKQLVDYDVERYQFIYHETEKVWYYLADYDEEDGYGVLKVYDGKESKAVGEDVVDFIVDDADRLFYINDYSDTYECGALYYYNGKDSVKIDDDVTAILPIIQGGSTLEMLMYTLL